MRKKLFYKIGEVCEICGVEAHVLRYWESEFPVLSPAKNRAGQRIYRQKDVDLIERIRYLLHEEGFTIAGAQKKFREEGGAKGLPLFKASPEKSRLRTVRRVKQELLSILELLDR